jgi:hypothetical protein
MSIKNTVFAGFLLLLTACSVNVDVRDGTADKISASQQKIAFWSVNRSGTNIFNTRISRNDIKAAKAYGVQFVRICLDKFPSKQQDFLIGNADNSIAFCNS